MSIESTDKIETSNEPVTVAAVLASLWSARKLIAVITGTVTVLSLVIGFLLAETFLSQATILPEMDRGKLTGIGGISDIAALAGINVGENSLAKLYPAIIQSEAVLKNVIYAQYKTKRYSTPVNLIQFWEIDENTPERSYEVTLQRLRNELGVGMDTKTGIITLSIETREPQLSADILNSVCSELDKFLRTRKTTTATEQRKWIEGRLVEVQKDLEKSENTLKDFRESNRRVGDSPQLLLLQERLIREVQINSTLYTELKKQYELIKIEEIKNIPIVNVMDAARPAARKEHPKKATMMFYGFFLSFAGTVLYKILQFRYAHRLMKVLAVVRGGAPER